MDIESNELETKLETKAGIPSAAAADAVVTHAEMMRAFESFKEANDVRLDVIAKKGGDVVLEEKVERINSVIESHQRFIDDAKVKAARPTLGDVETRGAGEREYKAAFDAFIRHGDSAGLHCQSDVGALVFREGEAGLGFADRKAAGRVKQPFIAAKAQYPAAIASADLTLASRRAAM
jgi:predicted phage gp36 major capsid-like protein